LAGNDDLLGISSTFVLEESEMRPPATQFWTFGGTSGQSLMRSPIADSRYRLWLARGTRGHFSTSKVVVDSGNATPGDAPWGSWAFHSVHDCGMPKLAKEDPRTQASEADDSQN
jgi:hypothetical protein